MDSQRPPEDEGAHHKEPHRNTRVVTTEEFDAQLVLLQQSTNKQDKQLLKAIEREVGFLQENPQRGIRIQKKKIPQAYKNLGVTNLRKINLPNYWRMLYTLAGNEIEIISILLEFMSHKDYDKKFKYK